MIARRVARALACVLLVGASRIQAQQSYDDLSMAMLEQVSLRSFDVKKLYCGPVYALVFGPDDKTFYSSGVDPRLHVWDFFSAQDKERLVGHTTTVLCMLRMKNGNVLTAGQDGTIRLWDVGKKQSTEFAENERIEQVVSFQTTAAAITGSGVNEGLSRSELKAAKSREMITKGKGGARSNAMSESVSNKKEVFRPAIYAMAVSQDEKYLVSGDSRGIITAWQLNHRTPTRVLFGHMKRVNCLAFRPKTHQFASGGDDHKIVLWNWESGQPERSRLLRKKGGGHAGPVTALAYNPNGTRLASGGEDGKVIVWHFRAKDTFPVLLEGHSGSITQLAFTKNGKYLISASKDNTIRIWEVETLRSVQIYAPRAYPVTSFAVSPSENFILTSGFTDVASIRVWQLRAVIEKYEKESG